MLGDVKKFKTTMPQEANSAITTGIIEWALSALSVIGGIVMAVLGVIWPMIQVIRKFSADKVAEIKRSEAEITLYEQLKEQLANNKRELDEALRENRHLWEIIKVLEHKIAKIEHIELDFEEFRNKLEEKDKIISQRDSEIDNLRQQLQIKENEIKDLEARVAHLESLLERRKLFRFPSSQ